MRIVPDSLENFLSNDPGNDDRLSSLQAFLEKKILTRGGPAKEIDPDGRVNEYPQTESFSSLSNPLPTGLCLRDPESLWPFRGG